MYKRYSIEYSLYFISFLLFLIILDQVSKILIARIMLDNSFESIEILPFLNLTFVRNTGISFGLFSDGGLLNRYFFTIFSFSAGIILFLISFFNYNKLIQISLVFISGGAIGNAIDRTYFGGVIDFIDFFIYTFHWPVFNLADVFITFGVVVLLLENTFGKAKNV